MRRPVTHMPVRGGGKNLAAKRAVVKAREGMHREAATKTLLSIFDRDPFEVYKAEKLRRTENGRGPRRFHLELSHTRAHWSRPQRRCKAKAQKLARRAQRA